MRSNFVFSLLWFSVAYGLIFVTRLRCVDSGKMLAGVSLKDIRWFVNDSCKTIAVAFCEVWTLISLPGTCYWRSSLRVPRFLEVWVPIADRWIIIESWTRLSAQLTDFTNTRPVGWWWAFIHWLNMLLEDCWIWNKMELMVVRLQMLRGFADLDAQAVWRMMSSRGVYARIADLSFVLSLTSCMHFGRWLKMKRYWMAFVVGVVQASGSLVIDVLCW